MLQPVGNFLCGLHVSYKNISQKFYNIKRYQIGIQQRCKYSRIIYIQKFILAIRNQEIYEYNVVFLSVFHGFS